MGQNCVSPKMIPEHLGCAYKCNVPILSPLYAILAPSKIAKCLEKGLFWDQKWVKNGSKMFSSKKILDHLGCTNH